MKSRTRKPRTVETVVTYLEMTADPHQYLPPPANVRVVLLKAEKPPVHYYRYLYDTIGTPFHWVDRKLLSDEELAAAIHADNVDIFVLYAGGVPGGFFEVDHRKSDEVELKYLGVIPDFQGRGLGKWLMSEAITCCWLHAPLRVIVETCTLDSPAALPLYQRMGFTPYDRKSKVITLAD